MIRQAAQWVLEGASLAQVAKRLNDQGILSPSEQKTADGQSFFFRVSVLWSGTVERAVAAADVAFAGLWRGAVLAGTVIERGAGRAFAALPQGLAAEGRRRAPFAGRAFVLRTLWPSGEYQNSQAGRNHLSLWALRRGQRRGMCAAFVAVGGGGRLFTGSLAGLPTDEGNGDDQKSVDFVTFFSLAHRKQLPGGVCKGGGPLSRRKRMELNEERRRKRMGRLRVCCYLRRSVEEAGGLLGQRAYLEQVMKEHPLWEVVGWFVDDGASGYGFGRPGFLALEQRVEEKGTEVVLVKDFSRLGRNYKEVGALLKRWEKQGIRLLAPADGVDTAESRWKEQFLALALKTMGDECYLWDISQKEKAARRAMKSSW